MFLNRRKNALLKAHYTRSPTAMDYRRGWHMSARVRLGSDLIRCADVPETWTRHEATSSPMARPLHHSMEAPSTNIRVHPYWALYAAGGQLCWSRRRRKIIPVVDRCREWVRHRRRFLETQDQRTYVRTDSVQIGLANGYDVKNNEGGKHGTWPRH